MDRASDAYALMASGRLNCAQVVLSTYSDLFGLDRNLALQVAMGFGGGMGRTGMICGAVTGAYMVFGLANKISMSNTREALEETYSLVREFNSKFRNLHSTIICKELIGYDLSVPESLTEARTKAIFSTVCPNFVRDSVRIIEMLLQIH